MSFSLPRFVRWIVFNLVIGSLPLVLSTFSQWSWGKPIAIFEGNSPDLLFLSIVACATALDDLMQTGASEERKGIYTVFFLFLLLETITSAVWYGLFLSDLTSNATESIARKKWGSLSAIYSGLVLMSSVFTEAVLHWFKKEK